MSGSRKKRIKHYKHIANGIEIDIFVMFWNWDISLITRCRPTIMIYRRLFACYGVELCHCHYRCQCHTDLTTKIYLSFLFVVFFFHSVHCPSFWLFSHFLFYSWSTFSESGIFIIHRARGISVSRSKRN